MYNLEIQSLMFQNFEINLGLIEFRGRDLFMVYFDNCLYYYMSTDLRKGSFGNFSSFCVNKISKSSKFSRFCKHGICVCGLFVQSMQLHTHQIYRNMKHFEILLLASLY